MSKNTQLGNLVNGIYVDSTGRVGVGTQSPSVALDVVGAGIFSGSVTATSLSSLFKEGYIVKATTTGGGGSQPAYTYYTAAGSKRWASFLDVGSDKYHISNASNTELFTITQTGNVGIGTTSPTSYASTTFQVNGSGASASIKLTNTTTGAGNANGLDILQSTTDTYIYNRTTGMMVFGTSDTERMRINSDGTMILGGTSSSGTAGSGSGRGNFILSGSISNVISFNNNSTSVYATIYSDSGEMSINSSSFMQLRTGGNDRVRITNGGNILMGTTTDNGYKLNVSGNIFASSNIYAQGGIGSQGGIVIDYGYAYGINSNNQVAANAWYMQVSTSFSNYFRFFYGGTGVGQGSAKAQIDTNGTYTALSDANKKKDISITKLGLAEVLKLKPSTFKFIDDEKGEEQLGFIAQEVKDIIPHAYHEDVEGDNKFIGLKYDTIIPVLVKAIQELKEEIETLKQK